MITRIIEVKRSPGRFLIRHKVTKYPDKIKRNGYRNLSKVTVSVLLIVYAPRSSKAFFSYREKSPTEEVMSSSPLISGLLHGWKRPTERGNVQLPAYLRPSSRMEAPDGKR